MGAKTVVDAAKPIELRHALQIRPGFLMLGGSNMWTHELHLRYVCIARDSAKQARRVRIPGFARDSRVVYLLLCGRLPDTHWYGTGYRYSASQRNSNVKALRFGRIPNISRGRRRRLWRRCRRRSRSPVFFTIMLALLHRLFQLFLVVGKQSMNLAVRFVADSVNLRSKLLSRSFRILIDQRLNPIVVLLKQRPDLLLLFRSQLQILRKASKFLVDRLRRMDMLKLLTR